MKTPSILEIEGQIGPKEIYALRTMFHLCGYAVVFDKQASSEAITIDYSEERGSGDRGAVLWIKREPFFWDNGEEPEFIEIEGLPLPVCQGKELPLYEDQHVNYDLPFVFWYFLSGSIESQDTLRDSHGRPIPEGCYLGRNGLHNFPLLNHYVGRLQEVLQKRFRLEPRIPLWPDGKTYAVGLSHDVDHCGTSVRDNIRMHRFMTRTKPLDFSRILQRSWGLIFSPDRTDNFENIMDFEERNGVQSTFFFGSIFDNYNISHPTVRKAINRVARRGWEVGLHPSYDAWQDENSFRLQKAALEEVVRKEVHGVRHHFWRMDSCAEKTLAMQQRLGFKYDASLAFNDVIGFRRGCAFPYFPYSKDGEGPLSLLEIPSTIMDGAVLYEHRFIDKKSAISKVLNHIEEVKKTGGLAILDWHSYMWRDSWYPLWGDIYRNVLPIICSDKDCYAGPMISIFAHILEREGIFRKIESAYEC